MAMSILLSTFQLVVICAGLAIAIGIAAICFPFFRLESC